MNSQLTIRIRERMQSFSKGQRRIAAYIEEHFDTVAFMTASRLGAAVGVSESTVVRFATELGYSGYAELQRAMQDMIRNRLNSVQRLEFTISSVPYNDLLEAVMNQDIDMLRRTLESISKEEFYAAVESLVQARRVYILGSRSSLALATFMAHYFHLIFEDVHLLDATNEAQIFEQLVRLDKKDAVIGISFPRYSKKVIKAMRFASDTGATCVALTDCESSPVAMAASHKLLVRSDMVSFVDSLVAPLSMINAFIVAIAIRKQQDVRANLQRLERIWDEYGIYEKVDENEDENHVG